MPSVPFGGSIAHFVFSCAFPFLEPHPGVEPGDRALEERCLFRLAYEAYPTIAHPSNKKSPDLSEPLQSAYFWRRVGLSSWLGQ